MGEQSAQGSLFLARTTSRGRDTFQGWLALEGPQVLPDADFRDFYVLDNGRKSAPPTLLMPRMVLLQRHDKVSDAEAVVRSEFDLR